MNLQRLSHPVACMIQDALPAILCDDLVQVFTDHPEMHFPGQVVGADGQLVVNTAAKRTVSMNLVPKVFPELDKLVYMAVGGALAAYMDEYPRLANIEMEDTGYVFNVYEPNLGMFSSHVDSFARDGRLATLTLYLNEVLAGGETVLEDPAGVMNAVITGKKGDLLIHPAGWMFGSQEEPPLSSRKFTLTTHLVKK